MVCPLALILPCAYAAPPFLDNKESINIRAMVTLNDASF